MRIVNDFPLPIKTVSEEEKKRLESDLRRSNKILKFHHQAAKKAGFSGGRRSFFASVCSESCPIRIPEEDLKAILDAKKVEQDFLAIYSRMIFKISGKWSRRLRESTSNDEVCAAAVEGFLNAFCSFTEEKRFSTYLTHCVNRHIIRFISSSCHVPYRISVLKSKIAEAMMNGTSFDSALESLNLPERTKREVFQSMFEVFNLSPEIDVGDRERNPPTEIPELSGLEFVGLEKLVFEEFMNSGGEINLASLSRRTINPKTNKPYSKMSMCFAWRRVRDRISVEFAKVA